MNQETNKVDQQPWMRATNWLKMFVGWDMKILVEGCLKPNDDAFLSCIWKTTLKLIEDRCMKGIRDCYERSWHWKTLMQWLASVDPKSASATPFSQYLERETVHRYATFWAGLVVLCLRNFHDQGKYRVPLSEEQVGILSEIEGWREKQACEDEESDLGTEGTEQSLEDVILRFSKAIIMYEDWKTVGVIPFYCGVLGYKIRTGSWSSAMEYTPTLAGIQFCMRVLVFESILPMDQRYKFNTDSETTPSQIFQPIRDQWLVNTNATPFNYVHSLLNYGYVVSKGTIGTDHISFSYDNQVLYYDGVPLYLNKWVDCLHKEVDELERLTRKLLCVSELPTVDLYSIIDHHSMTDKDCYFGTQLEGGFEAARERMIAQLERNKELDIWLDKAGNEDFNKETVLNYELDVAEWLLAASVAALKTCGLAGRGYEMLSIRYRNHVSSLRNIIVHDGQMMIVTVYHKSMGIMDETKVLSMINLI